MSDNLEQVSRQAEVDLNTYQAKTGNARREGHERKFDSADVSYGDDLSTNKGDNRRIPPSEGGELDARGRQTTGRQFEGEAGPEGSLEQTGENDPDVVGSRLNRVEGDLGRGGDVLREGQKAARSNVGRNPPGVGGSQFKGEDYYTPESVPDSIAAEGWVPPESVTQASRETEGYERK
ncbi:hypothetical protein PT974_10941 [Cladobotryum mycophilum]|uniref:Uncharacterized protein n=1 Tax=Cladobotryum mycophilum TaxID=491253 RepID=A0ABR0SB77_9HYPO